MGFIGVRKAKEIGKRIDRQRYRPEIHVKKISPFMRNKGMAE